MSWYFWTECSIFISLLNQCLECYPTSIRGSKVANLRSDKCNQILSFLSTTLNNFFIILINVGEYMLNCNINNMSKTTSIQSIKYYASGLALNFALDMPFS